MNILNRKSHRIAYKKKWVLQQKRRWCFIPYWETILESPDHSDCFEGLKNIQHKMKTQQN